MQNAPDADPAAPLPASLILLRRLVTVLTVVMILGVVTVVGLLVIRLQASDLPLPDQITLPAGVEAISYTAAPGWYGVVTTEGQLLIFDADSGELRQTVEINIAPE